MDVREHLRSCILRPFCSAFLNLSLGGCRARSWGEENVACGDVAAEASCGRVKLETPWSSMSSAVSRATNRLCQQHDGWSHSQNCGTAGSAAREN